MKLVDPVAPPTEEVASLAPRLGSLDGARIGLWSNQKLNTTELLDAVEAELRSRHALAGVVRGTYATSRVMRPDEWQGIDGCDAVVLTHGD